MNGLAFEFFGLMAAFGISAVIPGADFATVLRQSVVEGRKAAIITSAGIASAILVHGAYTLFGIGLVISQSLLAFTVLKWLGAAYLLWLGIGAFRSPAPKPPEFGPEDQVGQGGGRAFLLGFLTNLLNPKAVLFFLALFTTLVSAATPQGIKAGYVVAMSVLLFAWFTLVSVFFTTPSVRQGFFRMGRWFNRLTGITFIALAVRVALMQRN